MDVPEAITCVECGGIAHRMGYPPPDGDYSPGDAITFVCADCGHRHDVIADDGGEGDDEYRPGRVP